MIALGVVSRFWLKVWLKAHILVSHVTTGRNHPYPLSPLPDSDFSRALSDLWWPLAESLPDAFLAPIKLC